MISLRQAWEGVGRVLRLGYGKLVEIQVNNETIYPMIEPKSIDELSQKLSQLLPPELAKMQSDVHAQMKRVLQSGLQKMELVTREEFDVQTRVLQKTREKLTQLEERVAQLEQSS